VEKGGGRGPGGSLAHQELTGEVFGAGGGLVAAQSVAAELRSVGRIGNGGGFSRRGWSIPHVGRKRTARRCSSVGQESRGRRRTPMMDDGRARVPAAISGERARTRDGERKRGGRAGRRGAVGGLQGVGSAASRRWPALVSWEPPRRSFL
jgi:hypothetical protein